MSGTIYQQLNIFGIVAQQYYDNRQSTSEVKVQNHIDIIHTWVTDQDSKADSTIFENNIHNLGDVLQSTTVAIAKVQDGNTRDIMEGCLEIGDSVGALIAGPYGVVTAAATSILGSLLAAKSPSKPDLATVIANIVHNELLSMQEQIIQDRFEGLKLRVTDMMGQLPNLSKSSKLPNIESLSNEFLQFLGQILVVFTRNPLGEDSKEEDADIIVNAMIIYCFAHTCLKALLYTVVCKYHQLERLQEAVDLIETIQRLEDDATDKLRYLSEDKYLGVEGTIGDGKMYKILAICQRNTAFQYIEAFRQNLSLAPMLPYSDSQVKLMNMFFTGIKYKIAGHPKPEKNGDNHYFQLINETDFPVKIISGYAGDHVNGMKFIQDVEKRSSYSHVASKRGWTFSCGGTFCIYLDNKMQPDETPFDGNVKVFEFAMSNPLIGNAKIKLMEKTDGQKACGSDCWKQMKGVERTPIYFAHKTKSYMAVAAGYTRTRKGYRTWKFIVQDVDFEKDIVDPQCFVM